MSSSTKNRTKRRKRGSGAGGAGAMRTGLGKPLDAMNDAERKAFVSAIEDGSVRSQARPRSSRGELLWRLAKRGPGRPRKERHEKAVHVNVTVEPALLQRADAFAKSHGISRAQLFANGLRVAMGLSRSRQQF